MNERRFFCSSPERLRSAARAIAAMPVSERHPLEVVVGTPRREKTTDQRRLWHAMLAEMAAAVGYTPAQMKDVVKREYYGVDVVQLPTGHRYPVIQSSETEDRDGYGRLIEFTMQFAAENGITITDRRQP